MKKIRPTHRAVMAQVLQCLPALSSLPLVSLQLQLRGYAWKNEIHEAIADLCRKDLIDLRSTGAQGLELWRKVQWNANNPEDLPFVVKYHRNDLPPRYQLVHRAYS